MFLLLNKTWEDLYLPHRVVASGSSPYASALIPDLKYYFTVCLDLQN